jgi:hypothetical protein
MRQRLRIAASATLLTCVLLGHACTGQRVEGQTLISVNDAPQAAADHPSQERLLLCQAPFGVVAAATSESSKDDVWNDDPAEKYVHALTHDNHATIPTKTTTPAKATIAPEAAPAATANAPADPRHVTAHAASAASTASQPRTDYTNFWLPVVIPLAAGAVALLLVPLVMWLRRRRRPQPIPHLALLNMPQHKPVAEAGSDADASTTGTRRAA